MPVLACEAEAMRVFLICSFLATSMVAHNIEAGTLKFHVDPAASLGTPAVLVDTDSSQTVCVRFNALQRDTSSSLTSSTMEIGPGARIEMPSVGRDTYVETCITSSAEQSDPIFSWRTLVRKAGTPLIRYQGTKQMLPPDDFDEYWANAKNELAAIPFDTTITEVPDRSTSTGLLHRVEFSSVEHTRIVCWYFVPRSVLQEGNKGEKLPAIIVAPGYGAEEPPIDRTTSGIITLSVNPRNHGPSRAFWKSPVEHLMYNITDSDHYYYRLAYLDCLRAAQFLFSRPEVDKSRVATEGGSQGGLFAIATAALEPRIACVCSNVTAFTDYPDGMVLATKGHHSQFRELLHDNPTSASAILRALSYVDGANMITRVKCPVQFNMGGQDPVCPYVCGIVAHNRLPQGVAREFHVIPDAKHEVPNTMRQNNACWYKRWLQIN